MANKKTYGVRGVMEWVTQIKAGKATISVHFSGGYPTTNGHTPAEFTTDNEVIQTAIERSEYYRKGHIKLLKEYGAPAADQVQPRQPAAAPKHTEQESGVTAATQENEITEVKIGNLADAVSYLKANYGISSSKAKTLEAAIAIGESVGVKFVVE